MQACYAAGVHRARELLLPMIAGCALGCTSANPAYEGDADADADAGRTETSATSLAPPLSDDASSIGSGGATSAASTTGDPTTASADDAPLPDTSTGPGDDPPRRVLLVTGTGDATRPVDMTLVDVLGSAEGMGAGLEVVLVDDAAVTASDADEVDAVVVSETCVSEVLGGKLRDVPRPVIVLEGDAWNAMGMSGSTFDVIGTSVFVQDPGHPIAAGLSGQASVLTSTFGSGLMATAPPRTAHVIARVLPAGLVVVFAYEAGMPMVRGLLAPAARVGMGFDADAGGFSTGDLDEGGQAMVAAALAWVLPP